MKINHNENGSVELITAYGVLTLTMNEKWELYNNLKYHNSVDTLVDLINSFAEWNFVRSKEDVIADSDLIDDLVDDIDYDNIDIVDEDELYYLLERYLDVKMEDDE